MPAADLNRAQVFFADKVLATFRETAAALGWTYYGLDQWIRRHPGQFPEPVWRGNKRCFETAKVLQWLSAGGCRRVSCAEEPQNDS